MSDLRRRFLGDMNNNHDTATRSRTLPGNCILRLFNPQQFDAPEVFGTDDCCESISSTNDHGTEFDARAATGILSSRQKN
jgi:hypothetical protein